MSEEKIAYIEATLPHLATKADLGPLDERTARIEATLPHLATKADVSDLRSEIANVHSDLRTEIANLRSDLRTEIGSIEIRLIKWALGVGVTATVAISLQIWGVFELLLTHHI